MIKQVMVKKAVLVVEFNGVLIGVEQTLSKSHQASNSFSKKKKTSYYSIFTYLIYRSLVVRCIIMEEDRTTKASA